MRSFIFDGIEYRSMRECCEKLNISYQKVRRLCRHYRRAEQSPIIAIKWCLGIEHKSAVEPKTFKYEQDLELSRVRQDRFKELVFDKFNR